MRRPPFSALFLAPLTVLLLSVSSAHAAAADETIRSSRTHSRADATEERRTLWGMSAEDWARYRQLADGPAAYGHSDLSPLHVMMLYTEGEEQRRWAERLVRYEHDEALREIRADQLFHETAARLYPPRPATRLPAEVLNAKRFLLFVADDCARCEALLPRIFKLAGRRHVDLYLVGAKDPAEVSAWAVRQGVPRRLVPAQLTINVDGGTFARLRRLSVEVPALYAVSDRQQAVAIPPETLDELLAASVAAAGGGGR